ncbi:MAG: FtsX-like permease family protein [Tannerella sp.]|jgi:hypothetical protein|nr:FtsX-like permease family protein [Tannerella sp.]
MKHILKIIWNQKRHYAWIFTEQVLVTAILMLSAVSLLEAYKKYKTPGMLDVENAFYVGQMFNIDSNVDAPGGKLKEEIREELINAQQSMNIIIENLRKLPYVKAITRGFMMAPYARDDELYMEMNSDSISIDDKKILAVIKISDEFGASVLNVEMEEGTWFENHPLPDGSTPVVITRQFADKAGWSTATGKKIQRHRVWTVTGVAAGLKQEPFAPSPVAIVLPTYAVLGLEFENLVKIERGMEKEFTELYYREFRRLIPSKYTEPLLSYMPSAKRSQILQSVLPVVLQGIPTLFLFVFAFIGTFGLYWMISQKRMKEFALRRALGSTKSGLMRIVVGESLLITCLAVLPALVLSFLIYDYTAVHVIAVSATIFIMLLFAVVSAWYPAWKVSRVNPAEALQYE